MLHEHFAWLWGWHAVGEKKLHLLSLKREGPLCSEGFMNFQQRDMLPAENLELGIYKSVIIFPTNPNYIRVCGHVQGYIPNLGASGDIFKRFNYSHNINDINSAYLHIWSKYHTWKSKHLWSFTNSNNHLICPCTGFETSTSCSIICWEQLLLRSWCW